MSPNVHAQEELRLRSDFAARVLARADALIASRRRRRAMLATAATALVLVAGGTTLYATRSPDVRDVVSQSAYVASSDAPTPREKPAAVQLSERDEAGAVRYLFPDASSLVRFDQSYSQMMSGIGVDDQALPADESQDEWL